MLSALPFMLLTLALLAAILWLAHSTRKRAASKDPLRTVSAETLLPQHYKYFPQICRALSSEDLQYLKLRASPAALRSARRARRAVALKFLTGLWDDYQRLNRLARVLTMLAPSASRHREAQRVWLAIQFRFRWYLLWLEIWSGAAPVAELQSMAASIGVLAAGMQKSMNLLQDTVHPTSVSA